MKTHPQESNMKKLFALASITALGGLVLVVGCDGGGDSSLEMPPMTRPGRPQSDGGAFAKEAGEPGLPGSDCKTPIPTLHISYTKALKAAGACTIADLENLSAFFQAQSDANEDITISEWAAVVTETCSDCVFSDGSGGHWTPILTTSDDHVSKINQGGCVEILSGNEACGKAYQQATECRLEACRDVGCHPDSKACFEGDASFAGKCKGAYNTMVIACGSELTAYEAACKSTAFTFEGPIKVQCITGGAAIADAGSDAN
jgi:hypothetical protein